jgi:ABC-type sugar transport system ATPase subunit
MSYLRFNTVTKRFGGIVALDAVSLSIDEGECHALMGENGAGKSTLGKILAGILRPDAGAVEIGGSGKQFHSAKDARAAGIGMVHQELALCPDLSIADNLLLGRTPRRWGLFVRTQALVSEAAMLLRDIAPELDVRRRMRSLSVAQRQLVQIASAIGTGARILVFDEPTSSLAERESRRLFGIIAGLRARGVTIIYVSHRLPEVFELADRISVLRDGRFVGTLTRSDATDDGLVRMMIGRPLVSEQHQLGAGRSGKSVLEVRGLSSPQLFGPLSVTVCAGEIVGVAGLVGAGRSEMARAMFGLDPRARGSVCVAGREISRLSVRARMNAGLAYLPEDRQHEGLALALSCRRNFSLTIPEKLSRLFFLDRARETALVDTFFRMLGIKAASADAPASSLSGGNQQKIVLAKWLARNALVYMLDEPTRGIDIGAKSAIHDKIREMAAAGAAVLLISSELPELLALSHRIVVLKDGELAGEIQGRDATQEHVLRMMSGLSTKE